jgi:hypothetical protein
MSPELKSAIEALGQACAKLSTENEELRFENAKLNAQLDGACDRIFDLEQALHLQMEVMGDGG